MANATATGTEPTLPQNTQTPADPATPTTNASYTATFSPTVATGPTPRQQAIVGLGVLGDSSSDEYRANDNRGGAYASTTLNWVELLQRYRGVNVGAWGTRAEPRRTGYEYNWARTGARALDLIRQGQHTGVAQQVREGRVSHVVIWIGSNDFAEWNGTYAEVYNGTLSDRQVQQKVRDIVSSITTAVQTVQAAGDARLMLVNLGDVGMSPAYVAKYPNVTGRQRVTNAIAAVNAGLASLAGSRDILLVDAFAFGQSIMGQVRGGNLYVDGVAISPIRSGDEPHHALLGDSIHAGTVMNGLLANALFIERANAGFDIGIDPFTNQEILRFAGIR